MQNIERQMRFSNIQQDAHELRARHSMASAKELAVEISNCQQAQNGQVGGSLQEAYTPVAPTVALGCY
jgi:hypothetical protein